MTNPGTGSAGELLIQYQLMKRGIDSARLTMDYGIDLVIYLRATRTAYTVQVKGTAVRSGEGATEQINWPSFPADCPAQFLALADTATDTAWLLPMTEAIARSSSAKPHRALSWYVQPNRRGPVVGNVADFDEYRLPTVLDTLLSDETPPTRVGG